MNFEEMLNSRGTSAHREKMPLGEFYRKQVDGKYRYIIDLKPALVDNVKFCEALKANMEWAVRHREKQQVHGELHEDSSGIYEIEMETGNFQTLASVLASNPAIVAQKGFIDEIFKSLTEYLKKMHAEGVYQLCLAPESIFVHKGSSVPMVLTQGSFFQGITDLSALYGDSERYVAPEVMSHGRVDERSDVYALGRLVEYLYETGSMPFEYRKMLKKATAQNPDERFQTLDEMTGALKEHRNTRRMLLAFVAAVALSLLAVWIYIEMVPETSTVEFVEPAPKAQTDDLFGSYYDPEMGIIESDTMPVTDLDRMYQQKAEEIFRKRYAQEADRILSEIYDDKRMNGTEKNYRANSQSMAEELIRLQTEMGEQAGLTEEEAGRIAQEIVDKLTQDKQAQITRRATAKGVQGEEEE